MLDFHYSDTWADPAKQWTPDQWKSLSDDDLYKKIYEYTKDCLEQMKEAGATPDLIQTGNEISYGMLWGTEATAKGNDKNRCYTNSPAANWERFITLLKEAGKACREVCPQAQIIIHSERTPKHHRTLLLSLFPRQHRHTGKSPPEVRGQELREENPGGGDGLSLKMEGGRHYL